MFETIWFEHNFLKYCTIELVKKKIKHACKYTCRHIIIELIFINILHVGRTLTAPAGDKSVGGCLTDTAKEVIYILFSCKV